MFTEYHNRRIFFTYYTASGNEKQVVCDNPVEKAALILSKKERQRRLVLSIREQGGSKCTPNMVFGVHFAAAKVYREDKGVR